MDYSLPTGALRSADGYPHTSTASMILLSPPARIHSPPLGAFSPTSSGHGSRPSAPPNVTAPGVLDLLTGAVAPQWHLTSHNQSYGLPLSSPKAPSFDSKSHTNHMLELCEDTAEINNSISEDDATAVQPGTNESKPTSPPLHRVWSSTSQSDSSSILHPTPPSSLSHVFHPTISERGNAAIGQQPSSSVVTSSGVDLFYRSPSYKLATLSSTFTFDCLKESGLPSESILDSSAQSACTEFTLSSGDLQNCGKASVPVHVQSSSESSGKIIVSLADHVNRSPPRPTLDAMANLVNSLALGLLHSGRLATLSEIAAHLGELLVPEGQLQLDLAFKATKQERHESGTAPWMMVDKEGLTQPGFEAQEPSLHWLQENSLALWLISQK
ncbi:unnamed protein product [Protopolystoma xenopodis]|uniref:Uncharacterized protein n=1 Tax=Protopolystoma xenopodis TaxID=117903 RepID=A0A3S5B3B3_9PLAT|nr:unnamed protein product [Protopolystoma xenopodis]